MDSQLQRQFILKYTNGELPSDRYNFPNEKATAVGASGENYSEFDVHDLLHHEFENAVLNSSEDVLVYYHASWCGLCMLYSHNLLSFQLKYSNPVRVLKISAEESGKLPWHAVVASYPILVLYPGNSILVVYFRTSESVIYPTATEISPDNLVHFLMQHSSTSTKLKLITSSCDKLQNQTQQQYHIALCQRLKQAAVT